MNHKVSLFISILLLFWSSTCFAEDKIKIPAKIIDPNGETVMGASARDLRTNDWYFSGSSGEILINSTVKTGKIEISSMGFKTKIFEFSYGSENIFLLEFDTALLNDVVVVGYAKQKKVNLTGAVENVQGDYLESRPVPNLSRGLQGLLPNLNITMYDGNPSRSPGFNIRGATSIGSGGSALVLIDGVEGDPNMLNPNDVESVSVLKDASSAAIYGSRGTFGVVLITTKNPAKDKKTVVTYSGNFSVNKRTVVPELVTDGYVWADHFNRAHQAWYGQYPTAINSAFPFSQEYLKELKRRWENPGLPKVEINPSNGKYVYYESHDWLKDLYKDHNTGTEHNLSISKSGAAASFLLSARYFAQDGIYRYNPDDYKVYNIRAKGSARLYRWLEAYNNFDFSQMKYDEPLYYGGYGFTSEVSMGWSMRAFPVSPMLNPDGTLTEMGARGIGDLYYGKNQAKTNKYTAKNTLGFDAKFTGHLNLKGDYTFSYTSLEKTRAYSAVPYSNAPEQLSWLGSSRLFNHKSEIFYQAANLYADYSRELGGHTFALLAGFNGESSSLKYLEISRDGLLYPDKPSFTLSNGSNYGTSQTLSEWSVMGFFFRINYDYRNRYLVEVNGRYDGSSKFPTNQRWGFFPSVSAAWRISEEPFMKSVRKTVSQLKIRGSYGSLGNGNIEPYMYLESLPVTLSGRIINGSYPTVSSKPNVTPDGLTWEVAQTLNLGLDLGLFNDRLSLTADMYRRNTLNMFTYGPTLPDVFGSEVPKGNYADMRTSGWEVSLSWRDQTGSKHPLKYGIRIVLADNKSVITKYYNPTKSLLDFYEGMTIGEIWGYETEGLFRDEEDIRTHADQSLFRSNSAAKFYPGDIKLRNLNGDEVIGYGNNTVDNPGDRKIIGNSAPRYTYGINIDLEWRNFALSVFGQGVGKRDWYPPKESYYFWGQYNRPYSPLPVRMLGNMYDSNAGQPNPDAYFPRLSGLIANNSAGIAAQTQTRYLQDASYFRLKNLTFSYALPEKIIRKVHISKLNIFFTGQNLFTLTNLSKYSGNIDPETIEEINPDTKESAFGGGNGYPMLKTYTFGLNITF